MPQVYTADFENTTEKQSKYIVSDLGINTTDAAVTIAGWIKFESFTTSSRMDCFELMNDGTSNGFQMAVDEAAGVTNLIYRRTRISVNGTTITAVAVAIGTTGWHHYALTYDGTNLRGYFDGALVSGPTAASGDGTVPNGNDHFVLGAVDGPEGDNFGSNSQARHFDGQMDDFIVFSVAISAGRVSDLYTNPCSPDLTNAIARYQLENAWTDSVSSYTLDSSEGTPTFQTSSLPYTCASAVVPNRKFTGLGLMGVGS